MFLRFFDPHEIASSGRKEVGDGVTTSCSPLVCEAFAHFERNPLAEVEGLWAEEGPYCHGWLLRC